MKTLEIFHDTRNRPGRYRYPLLMRNVFSNQEPKRIRCRLLFIVSGVLTPLSDCEQESVEKMDRRILGVSYMSGMNFHNGIFCCGFLCARIISLYSSTLCLPLSCAYSVSLLRLPRQGLPRLIYIARAITPSPLHGYHACVFTSRLPRHSSEFHFWVITPELSRSTTHVNRVIAPALVSSS